MILSYESSNMGGTHSKTQQPLTKPDPAQHPIEKKLTVFWVRKVGANSLIPFTSQASQLLLTLLTCQLREKRMTTLMTLLFEEFLKHSLSELEQDRSFTYVNTQEKINTLRKKGTSFFRSILLSGKT